MLAKELAEQLLKTPDLYVMVHQPCSNPDSIVGVSEVEIRVAEEDEYPEDSDIFGPLAWSGWQEKDGYYHREKTGGYYDRCAFTVAPYVMDTPKEDGCIYWDTEEG